jgi:hypothetical protein
MMRHVFQSQTAPTSFYIGNMDDELELKKGAVFF